VVNLIVVVRTAVRVAVFPAATSVAFTAKYATVSVVNLAMGALQQLQLHSLPSMQRSLWFRLLQVGTTFSLSESCRHS
jgi:hypothetical protein